MSQGAYPCSLEWNPQALPVPAGRLPTHVTLRVETADPYVQGDRVSPQYKPATITGGTIIQVPPALHMLAVPLHCPSTLFVHMV